MDKMITAEAVTVKAVTVETMDLIYIKDSIIKAAQWGFIRPKLGKDLFDRIANDARNFKRWSADATFASGDYVVHRYQDQYDVLTYDYFYNNNGQNTGEPQNATADFTPTQYYANIPFQQLNANGLEDALSWYVLAEALPNMQYKTGGHGIMTDAPEFQEAAALKRQIDNCYGKGDMFMAQAIDYICDNASDFTDYCPELKTGSNRAGIVTYYSDKQLDKHTYNLDSPNYRDYYNCKTCD